MPNITQATITFDVDIKPILALDKLKLFTEVAAIETAIAQTLTLIEWKRQAATNVYDWTIKTNDPGKVWHQVVTVPPTGDPSLVFDVTGVWLSSEGLSQINARKQLVDLSRYNGLKTFKLNY